MIETHGCAADGCAEACPRQHLMCIRHWRMVPAALRREVIAAYRTYQREGQRGRRMHRHCQELIDAQNRAVAAVREKELRKFAKGEESQHGLGF